MAIRRQPDDFKVEERLESGFAGAMQPERGAGSPYAVYQLTKTSLTTPEAVALLARAAGVEAGVVEYGGLKDKHARTVQHVSIEVGTRSVPTELSGPGWSTRLVGWSAVPMAAAAISGNRFEIAVRGLSGTASSEMHRRNGLLALREGPVGPGTPRRLLVVNYFGAQRFGSARHGAGWAGERLCRGDFEGTLRLLIGTPARKDSGARRVMTRTLAARWGDWRSLAAELPAMPERAAVEALARGSDFKAAFSALPHFTQRMVVEAFQSHLWNGTARRLAERISREAGAEPLRTADPFGEMVFPPTTAIGASWRELQVPMLAAGTTLAEPWKQAAAEALAEANVTVNSLRVPGLRRPAFGEALRPVFVVVDRFFMTRAEPEGGAATVATARAGLMRKLGFELPRGAYATVVLRALGQ